MSWQYFLKNKYHFKKILRKRMFCKEVCWGGWCFSKGITTHPLEHISSKLRRKLNCICISQLPVLAEHTLEPCLAQTYPLWCWAHRDVYCWRDDMSRESPTTRCECPAQVLVMLSHSSSQPCAPTRPWASGTVFCFILCSLPKDSLVTNDRITSTTRQSCDMGCICHFCVWPKLPLDFGPLELWKYAIKERPQCPHSLGTERCPPLGSASGCIKS